MKRKNIVFFVLIICKSTIVFAGYDPRGNGILALVPLAFFSQYINPDWLVAFPTGKIGGQEAKVQQSDAGNQKGSNSRTTFSQDSFRNQHSDDDGDDKPPFPPKENKKEPCGAECLPFPLRKVIQVGQAPISFTYSVNKEDLLTNSGNSPWCQIPLTQGATFVQVSLHWYSNSTQELSLWALSRNSAPLPNTTVVVLRSTDEIPESSSDIINLEGEFPSSSQSALSELQVEIQLLDDNEQILSNITFINFNNYAPFFQAFNPLGIEDFDMCNHQTHIHGDYFDCEATISSAPPFPNCQECQSIDNARSNYRQWLENLNIYVKGNEVLNFRIIIKHKEQ
ncbi:MAG: hypothetical protein ACR2PX_17180 [Endozoicomonas sp.]|uniref:hypothetical protein n=1 Tax=Endozoicomonas sp. TaxID=1892382 RepID=UPI003D9ADD87